MQFANQRAQAIAMLRDWAADQVAKGASAQEIHRGLINTLESVVGEFRCQFEVPGVVYWHIPETNAYFTTVAGVSYQQSADTYFATTPTGYSHAPMRITRTEWLSRQDIHFGYESDRL